LKLSINICQNNGYILIAKIDVKKMAALHRAAICVS